MTLALADLKTRLTADAPPRGGVPSSTQYEQCVKDAVLDYSRRRPRREITTLDIVPDTAQYTLPTDFLKIIRLETLAGESGVAVTSEGIVPLGTSFREEWVIDGNSITFHPTPTYTWTDRQLIYAAIHELTDSNYATLYDEDEDIFMLYAQALALNLIANAMSGEAVNFRTQGVSEDRDSPVEQLRAQMWELKEDYESRLRKIADSGGMKASYSPTDRAALLNYYEMSTMFG